MEELPDTREAGRHYGDGEQVRPESKTRQGIRGSQSTPEDSVNQEEDDGADYKETQSEDREGLE